MGLFSWFKKNESTKQKLEISDDSGFIGLINNDLYSGFVDEDWELEGILRRFTEQTNLGNCVIWSTGEPSFMSIHILDEPSQNEVFREVCSNIKVTNEKLWLVNYTDLTMVAQFESEKIPSNENSELEIPLENGAYRVTIRQKFNPENYNWKSSPNPCFEIIFSQLTKMETNYFDDVIWWQNDKR